jgi:hypothetical protein
MIIIGGAKSDCYLLKVNLQCQINCKQLSRPTTRQKDFEIITEAITSQTTNLNSMSIAGYVSICVQLYCVGFHCLSLHVSAYMAVFKCEGYLFYMLGEFCIFSMQSVTT